MGDGYVASFSTKYHYAYWRPVTANREAGTDGNPRAEPDPAWTPLVTTPPIPDYESAHAVAVPQGVLRTDRITFDTCSYTLPAGSTCTDEEPVLRRFTRLSKAVQENAEARISIGLHFRTAIETGLRVGDAIGDHGVRAGYFTRRARVTIAAAKPASPP